MDYKFEFVSIHNLELDQNNPRLPKSKQGKVTQAEIIDWMVDQASTIELMMAIGQNDFFPGEQLLVIPKEDQVGKFIVIEGNRRLTALKLLSNPNLTSKKPNAINQVINEIEFTPKLIPCLIFPKDEKIQKYLGFRHITGPKSWRLLEKAKYLYYLWSDEYKKKSNIETYRIIAKFIGSRSDYVQRLIIAYELFIKLENKSFYNIKGLDDSNFYLNYLVDSLNGRDNITMFMGVDLMLDSPLKNFNLKNFEQLIRWWFEDKKVKGNSEGLTSLNHILGSKKATDEFKKLNISTEDALQFTKAPDIAFQEHIESALEHLERADYLMNKVNDFYISLNDHLKEVRGITVKIKNFVDNKEDAEF